MARADWTSQTDAQLLAQCEVDTYRASGPGGQKRNKTSSAVRLRHPPSGLIVIAEESRSQHENRARALKRMREALYLKLRRSLAQEELAAISNDPVVAAVKNAAGRFDVGRKDPRFWPAAAVVLDVLDAKAGSVREAAEAVGVTTANLLSFLQESPKLWEQANVVRRAHGVGPLRAER